MGIFSSFSDLNKINTLLKQIEPKLEAIQYEVNSPYPNKNRIRVECGTISILMSEIMDIADRSSNSVRTASYFLFGRKMNLFQISIAIAGLVEVCERI